MVKIKQYSPPNIKSVFDTAKSMTRSAVSNLDFTVNSSGTVAQQLDKPIDPATGYWEQNVGSKAPRWILHVDVNTEPPTISFAKNTQGDEFASARQIGYVNNHGGSCAVFMSRIRLVFKKADGTFEHFDDWEWLLAVTFARPLAKGTSGERLTDFDPKHKTIKYQTRGYGVKFVGLVKTPKPTDQRQISGKFITYDQLTKELQRFLSSDDEEEARAQSGREAEAIPAEAMPSAKERLRNLSTEQPRGEAQEV